MNDATTPLNSIYDDRSTTPIRTDYVKTTTVYVTKDDVGDLPAPSTNTGSTDTAKDDKGKLRISLVPPAIITAIAKIRDYGNKKYHAPQNWRSVDIERYHEAFLRHVLAAWEDIDAVDPESGFPHLWHAACNLAFILEMQTDDWETKKNKFQETKS